MEQLIREIHLKIATRDTTSAVDEPEAEKKGMSGKEHIFYDLLEWIEEKEKSRQMMYYFHSYQECLFLTKARKLHRAENKLRYIERHLPLNLGEKTNLAMEVLYLPMKAYYLYAFRKHSEAIQLLKTSIERLDTLAEMGLKEAKWARLEQSLNISRVDFDSGNTVQAADNGRNLLHTACDLAEESLRNGRDRTSEVNYILDCLLLSCIRLNKETVIPSISGVINVDAACLDTHTLSPLRYLNLIERRSDRELLEQMNSDFEKWQKGPKMCRILSLCYLILLANQYSYSQKQELNVLLLEALKELRLSQSMLEKIINVYKLHLQPAVALSA
jgi:hypothetical protein